MSSGILPEFAAALHELNIAFACNVAFLILAFVAFVTRIHVRVQISRKFGYDDWFMCAAMVMYSATCAVSLVEVGALQRVFLGKVAFNFSRIRKLARLLNLCYTITVVAVKISLGFFFLQIFTIDGTPERAIIYGCTALSTISGLIFAVMIEATCGISILQPCSIEHQFNSVSIAWSVLNATSDLILTSLSVRALWSISLKPLMKLSAMALLGFACIGGAISVVRVIVNAGFITKDPIVQPMQISRWSTIEGGIYITTGCLVTLRPLLRSLWHRAMGSALSNTDMDADDGAGRALSLSILNGQLPLSSKDERFKQQNVVGEVSPLDRASLPSGS